MVIELCAVVGECSHAFIDGIIARRPSKFGLHSVQIYGCHCNVSGACFKRTTFCPCAAEFPVFLKQAHDTYSRHLWFVVTAIARTIWAV